MNTEELKLQIMRQIDSLDKSELEEFYGILTNYKNEQRGIDDWMNLSEEQRNGIIKAISEIDSGKGIPHNEVISKYRKKYSHA